MGFIVDVPVGTVQEAYVLFNSNKDKGIDDEGYAYALRQYRNEKRIINAAKDGKCYCQKCGDTKFLPHIVYDNGRYYSLLGKCNCINADTVRQAIAESGLINEVGSKTFASFETNTEFTMTVKKKAVDYLKAIKTNKKSWFYIGGQTGAGKSHICIAIANRFFQNNYKLKYMRWIDELRLIKSNLSNTNKIKELKEAEVLYIDDLFKGSVSEYDISLAFEIINYRDSNNLITIISSELIPVDLEKVDSALYGRIRANTGGDFMIGIEPDKNKNYRIKGENMNLFGEE